MRSKGANHDAPRDQKQLVDQLHCQLVVAGAPGHGRHVESIGRDITAAEDIVAQCFGAFQCSVVVQVHQQGLTSAREADVTAAGVAAYIGHG